MYRVCDIQLCAICSVVISSKDIGGEVTRPEKQLKRLSSKTKSNLKLNWDNSYDNNTIFVHYKCWNDILNDKSVSSTEMRMIDRVSDTLERYDTEETLLNQAKEVADLICNSNHIVCFTGAGISASAGISTYRGAAGIDTLGALATAPTTSDKDEEEEDVDYCKLKPTFAHTAITQLHKLGKMHGLFTQNCDNLHTIALTPRDITSDLHGNVFREYCEKCFKEYERDYTVDVYSTECYKETWYVKCGTCGWNHYTGRLCDDKKCKGKLRDTIVNFGDHLHEKVCGGLEKAIEACATADLCICLGSSLTVFPACDLPLKAKNIVIVNLQVTDLDEKASIRIWATCDSFFKLLMPIVEERSRDKVSVGAVELTERPNKRIKIAGK